MDTFAFSVLSCRVWTNVVATPTLQLLRDFRALMASILSVNCAHHDPQVDSHTHRQPQVNVSPTISSGQLLDHLKQTVSCVQGERQELGFERRCSGAVPT